MLIVADSSALVALALCNNGFSPKFIQQEEIQMHVHSKSVKVIGAISLLLVMVFSLSGDGVAQEATVSLESMLQELIGSGLMEEYMLSMWEAQLKALADSDTADRLAEFTKNYYDALIREGFSQSEALQIVINIGIPAFHTPSLPNAFQNARIGD